MRRAALGLLAGALAALVYQNGLDAPFIFDDRANVLLNPSLGSGADLSSLLLHNIARPVLNLSYALDAALWGLSSFGFHVTNLILHLTVVGLFYGWCTRALTDAQREPELTPEWAAFFAAAMLGVHPLMTGTVNYVSARSELLAAIGFLASLTYARRAIVGSHAASGLIAVLLGIVAIGSSSSAAALPLVVLAYDAWVLRDAGWRRRAMRIYLPLFAIVATAAATQLPGMFAAERMPPRGLLTNLLAELTVSGRYAGLLMVPRGQAIAHAVNWDLSFLALPPIAVLAYLVFKRRAWPLAAFGAVWFIGVLGPTILVPVRDGMAEPRAYLASCGLLLAGAGALSGVLATRRVVRVGAAALIGLLAMVTWQRNQLWLDPMKVWEEAAAHAPGAWQAHLGYADLLREVHRCDRAVPEFREVLRLYPDNAAALAGLRSCD